jgi:hypothetical protein
VRTRFWIETTSSLAATTLLALTLIWRDWIEAIFGVDPDRGNGSLEWAIVAVSLVAAASSGRLAVAEWQRRPRTA